MPKASQKGGSNSQKPNGKSQSRRSPSDDDDDEDYAGPSQSQRGGSQSQARRHANSFNQEELDARITDLVRYILIMDKRKFPIKKLDINKYVLKEFSKAFDAMLDKAKTRLKEIFGVNVLEVEGKQKSYILTDCLPANARVIDQIEWEPQDHAKRGLILLVLSLIFMNNDEIQECVLWQALAKNGLYPDRTSSVFGDVKKLICTDLVRQGYLEYVRRLHYDPPLYDFKWGPRAEAEISKGQVLKFVCEIHGDGVRPEDWRARYQEVLRSEGQVQEIVD